MRLGILLSGRGSNFQAIQQAIQNGEVPAEIACVLSNVPNAPGILYAREQGLPAYALDSKGIPRAEFDRQLLAILAQHQVDLICLAGYLRLLSAEFIAAYAGRILNIHPSLLPEFKGLHAQRQALEAGATVSGCTVHYVDEGLDTGPILMQAQVPVLEGDTEELLSARILAEEHRLYPAALRLAIEKAR
jgi:phosphoribosylglycinamide formyltransferase 1